jgi:hypothetical protein
LEIRLSTTYTEEQMNFQVPQGSASTARISTNDDSVRGRARQQAMREIPALRQATDAAKSEIPALRKKAEQGIQTLQQLTRRGNTSFR